MAYWIKGVQIPEPTGKIKLEKKAQKHIQPNLAVLF